ncbi:MAG: lysylphosphatidylglycerol synthase transmembrane domain-containing protein [Chitinophagaceae bacterium]
MFRLNKNIKIFTNYFLGPALFIWLSASIYQQIKSQPHLETTWMNIRSSMQGKQSWMLWAVIALMFINWGIEARKWQVLLKPLEKISWLTAYKATFAGLAFAVNTPNRIGEYGGRIIYISESNRLKAVSLTVVGSMSQLLVTLLAGCGGLVYLLNLSQSIRASMFTGSVLFWIQVTLYIITFLLFVGLIIYFRLGWMIKIIDRVPAFSRLVPYINVLEGLTPNHLFRILSLSCTRYLVFVGQYILMILLMQVQVSVWQAFWLVTVIYLVLAIVPTIALAEIGLRGKISLELFGLVSVNNIGIVAATIGIWSVNLIIPALIGSLFVLRIKIFKNQ